MPGGQETILVAIDFSPHSEAALLWAAKSAICWVPAYKLEMDILQNLKRIFYFAKRMAKVVVPAEVELRCVS